MKNGTGIKKAAALLFILCCAVLGALSVKAQAASGTTMYIDAEGEGNISGCVGYEITPYYFTVEIKKGSQETETPSFKYSYESGRNVTDWFQGICDPERNIFKMLPKGLVVKTAKAINAGDTKASFVITGTPYMASSGWLQIGIAQSVFDGNPAHTNKVETGKGIQFSITRENTNVSLKLSPTKLTITGAAGSAVSASELTVSFTGGNFIAEYPANKDVSEWFRGSDWVIGYDGEYMTAKLPAGMTVKLKKAVKVGDKSCTFVISGTPACGATEYIVPVIPAGSIAFAGSERNEHGYGPQGFGCNGDYMFKITGETNKPGIELESVKVNGEECANITGIVGAALADNLLTYRMKNCTLATSYAAGYDITGFFLKWNYPFETCVFDGMGVKVEVVDFTAGKDYFTCRMTGTPKKSGSGALTVKLYEEHTSAGVRMSSMSSLQRKFGFSTPDENATVSISTQTYDCKLGFMLDTSGTPAEIEISQGYTTEYCLNGAFTKGQDVSALVEGLPSGVKAYSAENRSNMSTSLYVYFKGIPSSTGVKKVYASVGGSKYYSKPKGGSWSSSSGAETYRSETYVTISITAASETGFAYSYRLDPDDEGTGAVSGLSYEALKAVADSEAIALRGSISTKQAVVVEDKVAAVRTKSVYNGQGLNLWLYIPQITFDKSYNELALVNDLVRLMKKEDGGSISESPITGARIYTETAIASGRQTGKNILIYIEGIAGGAVSSFDGLQLQIKDGGSWKNITMPTGSRYEIGEVVTGQVAPSLEDYNGLSASVADCSINGLTGQSLMDRAGLEVKVNGAEFTYMHKGNDVTDWFTNLPEGLQAVVKEDAPAGSTSVKIRFGKLNSRTWKIGPVTPTQASTGTIRLTVPFKALSGAKFINVDGGIVAAENAKARYNILTPESFAQQRKAMVTSVEFTGEYRKNGGIGDGSSTEYSTVYIPGSLVAGYSKPVLTVTLIPEEGELADPAGGDGIIMGILLSKSTSISENVYYCNFSLYLPMINASGVVDGEFGLELALIEDPGEEAPDQSTFKGIEALESHVAYSILAPGTSTGDNDDVDPGSIPAEEEEDDPLSSLRPDIWIGGKDNKKTDTYYKTTVRTLSDLISSLPEGCKYVVSVTSTAVEDVSGAFSSGKGKKSNVAKASVKAKTDQVTVSAGKTPGTARIWVAAYDSKQKKIVDYGSFDVVVGLAPKKFILVNERYEDVPVKTISLNKGESVFLLPKGVGAELSAFSRFSWTEAKDGGNVELSSMESTGACLIIAKGAPTGGKVIKTTVIVQNLESGKKVNLKIIISNEVVAVDGLDKEIETGSASESKAEMKLNYSLVCEDSGPTTDKVKVYVTSSTEEGSGYTLNNNKFKLTQKSGKIKAAYKNGEFTLTVAKGTAAGTKARVLIVVTHADRTVDVYEGGVITVG